MKAHRLFLELFEVDIGFFEVVFVVIVLDERGVEVTQDNDGLASGLKIKISQKKLKKFAH